MFFVVCHFSSETARHGPHRTRFQHLQKHGVRHQSGNASVAIPKWVNPQKTMMRWSGGENGVGLSEMAINFLKPLEEPWNCSGTDRYVSRDLYVSSAQFARDNFDPLLSVWVSHPQQILW